MAEPPTSHCPNRLAEYRPGFDTCAYGGAIPESRMIRVWVLESQLDEARASRGTRALR